MARGAHFAGWGFMRFNEPSRERGAQVRGIESDADGDGEDELFPGRVSSFAIMQQPSMLGATPNEMRAEWARRKLGA